MRLAALLTILPVLALAGGPPAGVADLTRIDDLPVITVPDRSARVDTLDLVERWRFDCSETSETLVGRVHRVASGGEGRVLLVDRQLDLVHVLDRDGRALRTCGRAGEGPGETTCLHDAVELADGSIALVEGGAAGVFLVGSRGGLHVWRPDGALVGSWSPQWERAGVIFMSTHGARAAGGRVTVDYTFSNHTAAGMTATSRLVALDADGRPATLYRERAVVTPPGAARYREADEYVPFASPRHDLSADGAVAYVPDRDRYAVVVRRPDGSGFRLEGGARGRVRDDAERRRLVADSGPSGAYVPCDADPVLASLRYRPDGRLWVERTPVAAPPSGLFGRYDEFDPAGVLIRSVVLRTPGDAATDRMCLLADGRFALIRGHHVPDGVEGPTPAVSLLVSPG